MKFVSTLLWFLALLILPGCSSSKKPFLYPNHHLNTVGSKVAEADINDCMRQAEASGANTGTGTKLARETATAATVGAAAGAAAGAVSSHRSVGRGAATGGAAAATAKLVSGSIDSDEPTPIFMRFVDQCLRDKGYQPLGWR